MPAAKEIDAGEIADPIARRIAQYINLVFKGNIRAASAAIGCDYDVLYRAVQPKGGHRPAKSPSLDLLRRLSAHSKRTVDQWLE